MDNPETQSVISFCTGYGGLELGIGLAGTAIATKCYVEIEMFACANLVAKIESGQMDPAPIWTNLKTFPAEQFHGRVHGIIGGYPCQPFSNAGQRKGKEDPRHLWPYIRRAIAAIGPVWFFFENVEGHLSLGLEDVQASLRRMGYTVEVGIFSAAEVGAPHGRKRVFILGYAKHNGHTTKPKLRCDETPSNIRWQEEPEEAGKSKGANRPEYVQSIQRKPEGSKLGYAKHNGYTTTENRRSFGEKQEEGGLPESKGRCGEELADSNHEYTQGERSDNNTEKREEQNGQAGLCSRTRWPARPGQPQHEWEEPRVVVNSKVKGLSRSRESHIGTRKEHKENRRGIFRGITESGTHAGVPGSDQSPGTIKPGVGRAINGITKKLDTITNRVDRLRLLGNGVLPQTAAKAWVYLWEKINK